MWWTWTLAVFTPAAAQIGVNRTTADGSRVQFRNELNSYLWRLELGKQVQITPHSGFSIAEEFRSSMLKLANEKKWKDDQNLQIDGWQMLAKAWRLTTFVQSVSFIDNQTGLNSDIHTHTGQVGLQFSPTPRWLLRASVGPKWDYRFMQKDCGIAYSADAAAREMNWSAWLNSFTATMAEDVFPERRNTNNQATYQVSRTFAPGTADTLRLYSNYRRNDNYTSVLGDFESLRESNKGLQNALGYQVSSAARLLLLNSLQLRNVEVASYAAEQKQKSRTRNDQLSENSLLMYWQSATWYNAWQLSFQSQTQKYDLDVNDVKVPFSQRTAFITPNNVSSRLLLSSEWGWDMSRQDSLFVRAVMSRFQYDTPDTSNFDDRDEWRGHMQMNYLHRFGRDVQMVIQAGVNLYHMVYIFGERSADNNWNRIIRLRPGIIYQPTKRFRLFQSFEVLANYVDYDFETTAGATKSYVFRKFSMDDSLRWSLTDRTMLAVDYRLQMEENGQLYWDQWSERVLSTRASHWLQARLHYQSRTKMFLSPGFTVYTRDEWRHDQNAAGVEKRTRSGSFSSYGPMLRITYTPSPEVQVVADGVRRRVFPENQKYYYINNLDIHVEWHF